MSAAAASLALLGFGTATALGGPFSALREALISKRQGYRRCNDMIGADFTPVIAAFRDWPLDTDAGNRLDRLVSEAFADPMMRPLSKAGAESIGMVLCLREEFDPQRERTFLDARMAHAEAALLELAGTKRERITARELVLGGHAGAARGMAVAGQWLADGRCRHVVLVAVDSHAPRAILAGMVEANRLFNSSTNRWGLVPGEAGVVLHLASPDAASPVRIAAAEAFESVGEFDDDVTRHDALSQAAVAAVAAAGRGAVIGHWLADLNNARYRASEAMIVAQRLRLRKSLGDADIGTLTPFLGDVGAASLPLQMLVAGDRIRNEPAGTIGLATAGSWVSKLRGAATIRFGKG